MSTHTTPRRTPDQTDQAAEPARRAPRFDESGIALQTVIIMVVLLAIAGTVAAVLLTRAGQTTDQLQATDTIEWAEIDTATACRIAGGREGGAVYTPGGTFAAPGNNFTFMKGHCWPPPA